MSTVNRVKFLWDAAMTLNLSAQHINNILKSNLRSVCRKLAGTNTAIPLEKFSESQMCERCLLHWQDNKLKINYRPQKVPITTLKAKTLLKNLKDDQKEEGEKKLNRKQKIRAKWLLKKAKNKLIVDCEFCRHKTLIRLEKPEIPQRTMKTTSEILIPEITDKKNNIKKAYTKDNIAQTKSAAQNTNVIHGLPKSKQTQNAAQKPKVIPKSKQTKDNKKPPKQKNSLLQLAAMLRTQDNTKPSTKNRLESFLK